MKNFFTTLVLLCMLGGINALAAEMPENLSIKGSALRESTELKMKKIVDAKKIYFELITSLKSGECTFSDEAVPGKSVQVTDGEDQMIPYRIRVNYDKEVPEVIIHKIKNVRMHAPRAWYTISALKYIGNSKFQSIEPLKLTDKWGKDGTKIDDRYRVKVAIMENDVVTTYGPIGGKAENMNFQLASSDQWGNKNFPDYPELNWAFSKSYPATGDEFTILVDFNAEAEFYSHKITKYEVPTDFVLYTHAGLSGSAIINYDDLYGCSLGKGSTIGDFQGVVALKSGDLYVEAGTDEEDYTLTIDKDGKIDNTKYAPAFQITENGLYYVYINSVDEQLKIKKITDLYMWICANGEKPVIQFIDKGDGKYAGSGLFTVPTPDWEKTGDSRYKFTATLEDGSKLYLGMEGSNGGIPSETIEDGYYKIKIVGTAYDQWGGAFKLRKSVWNKTIDMDLIFNGDASITHEYKEGKNVAIHSEKAENAINIYSNPANKELTISADITGLSINIYNIAGVCVNQVTTINNSTTIPTNNMAPGIYILKIAQNGSAIINSRIIVL